MDRGVNVRPPALPTAEFSKSEISDAAKLIEMFHVYKAKDN